MAPTLSRSVLSAAIFSPQSISPKSSYLAHVRSRLLEVPHLQPLRDAVIGLPNTWDSLESSDQYAGIRQDGKRRVECLVDWINTGNSDAIEKDTSGLITLPLLTTIHMVQYLEYLQQTGRTHAECLEMLKEGGIQGYCIGLLSAIIVASSADEQDIITRAAAGIRISLAIGAFGDLAEALSEKGWTTMAIRLRTGNEEEEEEILNMFPGAYISTLSDAQSRSIIIPDDQVTFFKAFAEQNGLQPKTMHIRGKLHDPNNVALAKECSNWCETLEDFPSLKGETLHAPVRSNRTGECLTKVTHSLINEVIGTILASPCDWSHVIHQLASDLQRTNRRQHTLALFGIGNSVPLAPFRQHELEITKLDVLSFTTSSPPSPVKNGPSINFPDNAIAIVGAGCRLPGANSLDELWDVISQGQSRLERLRSDRANLKGSYRASQDPNWVRKRDFFGNYIDDVDAFDHSFFGISPREAKYMDPQQRLLLEASFDAMDSSGYLRHHQRERGDDIGCFLGASYTEYLENTSGYSPSAFTATGTIRAFLSGRISYHFGWTGPSEVIDTACSASIVAIHRACQAIITGECSMALAGGVNLITGINNYFDLGKASFLSQTGQCKPFDDSADGYCRSDGVGLVVLKSLNQAIKDGDHIMGVVPGVGTNQGGIHAPGITVPDGVAQRSLYRKVLEKSGIHPHQVSYVEAHGTGTQVGDPIEIKSIREVFGGSTRDTPLHLGSLKANIGHSETAAGVASVLKVLAMLRHGGIPPLQGFKRLNQKIPALEPDQMHIPTSLRPWNSTAPRIACVNSYGASGSNSALLCSEWTEEFHQSISRRASSFSIQLSAASSESLQRYTKSLVSFLSKSTTPSLSLDDLAYTLSERRKHHRTRWSTTATDIPDLITQLQKSLPADYSEATNTPKKVVLAFSGQSRTNIGLDTSVRECYPQFEHYITTCSDILKSFGCPDILPALSKPGPISDPVILQCGTVAVQYSCAKCWIDSGLQVDAVVGHSLGELAALAVSGALSLADALKVVYTRAELINAKWGEERGTMMAIHASLDVVQSIVDVAETAITREEDKLEIACYNSLTSHIVVGSDSSIALAEKILQNDPKRQSIRYQRLNVSHGFHSRFTAPLLLDLIEMSMTLKFNKPTIPLETSTKVPFVFEPQNPNYIANHAREPVYFVDAIQRLEKRLGACVWLEAGWGSPVVPMVKKAVADNKIHTFQSVTSPAAAAANLWQEGISVSDWSFLSPKDIGLKPAWLPPYSFEASKAWLDHVDHAIEEQQKAAMSLQSQAGTAGSGVTQLVSYKNAETDGVSHKFHLHTGTERFTRIVEGHAVRQKPLCPASMYMEAAVMGADKLGVELRGKTLTFQNITFSRPLGCGEGLDVDLCLKQTSKSSDDSWHYSLQSSANSVYSEGDFSMASSPHSDLDIYRMLVSEGIESLKKNPDTEKLRKSTAYSLFSRIVEYSDLLRGITSITLGNKQALAQIEVPEATFAASESTVSEYFDAISLDTFVQVLGLLINCNNASESGDEIYIASCIDKMVISPTEFQKSRSWTVYATYSATDSKTLSGAVFVFSEDGNLAAFGTKIQFTRTQAARLERVLEAANPRATGKPVAAPSSGLPRRSVAPAETSNPKIRVQAPSVPESSGAGGGADSEKADMLRSLVAAYSGIKESEIQDDVSFSSMGLDSLASMELAGEIESTMGIEVNAEDLLTGNVKSLLKLFPSSGNFETFENASRSSNTSTDSSSSSENGDNDDPTAMSTPPDYGFQSSEINPFGKSRPWKKPASPLNSRFKIETVVYKEIEGTQIPADLYVPSEAPPHPMPIALMIHGGGHLTLSRRAVRPAQTRFLLESGIFPVSVDYRLAPHVNVLDGSMADIRDACIWARDDLPKIMALKGFSIDPNKLVVIGWSTGGTLAMTTSWSLPALGQRPPLAVLSFYCPVEYNPDAPINMGHDHASRTMTLSRIRETLPPGPTTSHAFNSLDTTKLGWLQENDPRSELVLALIKEKNGMSLLFNGLPPSGEELPRADAERAAAFSPLVQVRNGKYRTPTYLIFGDEDEIAPFEQAVEFERALRDNGVPYGFLPVTGAKHIFDLGLTPGSDGWEIGVGPGYDFLIQHIESAL